MTKRRSNTSRTSNRRSKSAPRSARTGWALARMWIVYSLLLVVALLGIWTFYLDSVVRAKFEGKKWSLPARVYARPLELYVGQSLLPPLFEQELRALGYRFEGNLQAPGQVVKKVSATSSEVTYHIHSRGFDFWDKKEVPRKFMLRVANGSVQAFPERIHKIQSLASEVHHLVERVEVITPQGPQQAWVIATNVFHKTPQGWRLVAHHSSPGTSSEALDQGVKPKVLH